MHRAFSTLGCPALDLEQSLELAGRYGFQGIELRALGGSLNLPDYFIRTAGTAQRLAERVARQPVKVIALDTSFKLIGDSSQARENLLSYVPWAEALGGINLRVFDGGKDASDGEIQNAAETMDWWQSLRAAQGWKTDLMVETHDSFFTAQAIQRLVQAIPHCRVLWDTHHTWKRGKEDPSVTWRAIRAQVVHVHVKDSVSIASPAHPWSYVVPGTGEFPMASLREVWGADAFAGPLSLEWERLWHPSLPPLEQALDAAAQHGWW